MKSLQFQICYLSIWLRQQLQLPKNPMTVDLSSNILSNALCVGKQLKNGGITHIHTKDAKYLEISSLWHVIGPTHIDWWWPLVGISGMSETVKFLEILHTLLRNASRLLFLMLMIGNVHILMATSTGKWETNLTPPEVL